MPAGNVSDELLRAEARRAGVSVRRFLKGEDAGYTSKWPKPVCEGCDRSLEEVLPGDPDQPARRDPGRLYYRACHQRCRERRHRRPFSVPRVVVAEKMDRAERAGLNTFPL
jgi:hypothetical protein